MSTKLTLTRSARFPGMRVLAWDGDCLYASKGYALLRSRIENVLQGEHWQTVADFHPSWNRRLSVRSRLGARLFRDGFHALAVLPTGALIAAVPGAIVTFKPGETEFRMTHAIARGTRPLHITAAPNETVYFGEYFDNASRDEVHIYASTDAGANWSVAHTFPRNAIRHIHNIIHDPWGNCLWILTGDYGDECRVLRASYDLKHIEVVLQGKQQARAVAAVPAEEGLYFSTDTPLEPNFIYCLERQGRLSQIAPISSSSIYGCRVGSHVFFSTMVEPSDVNHDHSVRLYGSNLASRQPWQPVLNWEKDIWPMGLFQFGNAFLPEGNNTTPYLAVTTAAVKSDDAVTSLYAIT